MAEKTNRDPLAELVSLNFKIIEAAMARCFKMNFSSFQNL